VFFYTIDALFEERSRGLFAVFNKLLSHPFLGEIAAL
jgi:hypothetical protein